MVVITKPSVVEKRARRQSLRETAGDYLAIYVEEELDGNTNWSKENG